MEEGSYQFISSALEPFCEAMPPGNVKRTSANITRARKLFAYDLCWEFRDGGREFVEPRIAVLRKDMCSACFNPGRGKDRNLT